MGHIGYPLSLGIRGIGRENVVSPLTERFVEQFISAGGHRIEKGEPRH